MCILRNCGRLIDMGHVYAEEWFLVEYVLYGEECVVHALISRMLMGWITLIDMENDYGEKCDC